MQRILSASFGWSSLPACSIALEIEKESSQVKLSYSILSTFSLEMLLPYCVLVLAVSNWPRGKMHVP